jgi:hypothetical protein
MIPKGVEVLVKKASVDPAFRKLLLEKRAEAAKDIGLELSLAEAAMLAAIPAAQLEAVIASTKVEPSHVAAFMGKAAAVMLAALAVGTIAGCPPFSYGISPENVRRMREAQATTQVDDANSPTTGPSTQPAPPPPTRGTRPDAPPPVTKGIRP